MARAALSAILSRSQGVVGSSVMVMSRSGLVIKRKPQYRQFPNPATGPARERLVQAKEAWLSLNRQQLEAWRRYAASLRKRNPIDGKEYSPIAYNTFVGLATRVLQVNPDAEVPLWPPTEDFLGEQVTLEASMPAPGVIRFTASGPNSPGVTCELMGQPLPSIRRTPGKFYKSLAFHSFEEGALDFDLPVPDGLWALAYRFVRSSTGQTGTQLLLDVVGD